MGKDLRTIDFSKKHFECGGRKFILKDSLSFTRYRALEKMSLEFGFSGSFYDVFINVKTAFEYLNQMKPAEGAVVLYNIMQGIDTVENKNPTAWRICALFIDEEDEDPTVYDEGKMNAKIDCWGEELAVLPFFQLAANLVPSWIDVYQSGILDTLKVKDQNESDT